MINLTTTITNEDIIAITLIIVAVAYSYYQLVIVTTKKLDKLNIEK
jgi:hypothetical protein